MWTKVSRVIEADDEIRQPLQSGVKRESMDENCKIVIARFFSRP
jgi:hypothetical protein